MAKYRIRKGYFQTPKKGRLMQKVYAIQKRWIWGIWLNVPHSDAEDMYYFRTPRHAYKILNEFNS